MPQTPLRHVDKPILRGVSHQVAFVVALVVTALLVRRAHTSAGYASVLVFGGTLVLLFGTSACYHRVQWRPLARARMQRLDHAVIFLFIGGGYTPLFALAASPTGGHRALHAVWLGVGCGVLKAVAWSNAPKWLTAVFYLALGWMSVFEVARRAPLVGTPCIAWLGASGLTYTVGALVYAMQRPDPAPRVFGYHEVFHLLVCLGSAFLVTHVALVMQALMA